MIKLSFCILNINIFTPKYCMLANINTSVTGQYWPIISANLQYILVRLQLNTFLNNCYSILFCVAHVPGREGPQASVCTG